MPSVAPPISGASEMKTCLNIVAKGKAGTISETVVMAEIVVNSCSGDKYSLIGCSGDKYSLIGIHATGLCLCRVHSRSLQSLQITLTLLNVNVRPASPPQKKKGGRGGHFFWFTDTLGMGTSMGTTKYTFSRPAESTSQTPYNRDSSLNTIPLAEKSRRK